MYIQYTQFTVVILTAQDEVLTITVSSHRVNIHNTNTT